MTVRLRVPTFFLLLGSAAPGTLAEAQVTPASEATEAAASPQAPTPAPPAETSPPPSMPARAAPRVELSWTAPGGCPDSAYLRTAVEARLGRGIDAVVRRPLAASAEVEPANGAWRMLLSTTTSDGTGERIIEGPSCQAVADATALIIALAIDPEAVAAQATLVARAKVRHGRAPAGRWIARASIAADAGSLPALSPGLAVAAGWSRTRVRLDLGATYWLDEVATVAGRPAGGRIGLAAVAFRGCWAPVVRRLELWACAGVEMGSIWGAAEGAAAPRSGAAAWIAIPAGLLGAYVASRGFAVVAQIDLVVPLVRPRFVIEGLGEVFQTAPVVLRGLVGLEARFP